MSSAWAHAKNLLCVRLDAIGDVIMTTPAIRALKAACPGRRITLLTSPAGAEIAALMPQIDDVLIYQPPWMKATPTRFDSTPDYEVIDTLRRRAFDGAVIFTVYTQSALPAAMLCYLAQIPLRLGHCRENPYQLLPDWVLDPEPHHRLRHEVQRQLDLVASIGCACDDQSLRLVVPKALKDDMRQRLTHCGVALERPWLVIHPGASAPSRRYPAEKFSRVASTLARNHGLQVVFAGTEDERALVNQIRARMAAPSHDLAGQLDLHQLVALLALASAALTNNSGPAHIAAAVGTPVVDLYALTNLQHTPWQAASRVLFNDVPCKSCYKSVCPEGHHACLEGVSPESVAQAVLSLLEEATLASGVKLITVMVPPPDTVSAMAPRFGSITANTEREAALLRHSG